MVGGGGAACVVVVGGGGGVPVCVAGTAVAAAFCFAGFAWWCCFGLCAGLAAVVPVVVVAIIGVDCVVAVEEVTATLCEEVDEDDPQALTTSVSRMAASEMRSCLMVVSLPPGKSGCH